MAAVQKSPVQVSLTNRAMFTSIARYPYDSTASCCFPIA